MAVWDLDAAREAKEGEEQEPLRIWNLGHESEPPCAAISDDGDMVLVGSRDHQVVRVLCVTTNADDEDYDDDHCADVERALFWMRCDDDDDDELMLLSTKMP